MVKKASITASVIVVVVASLFIGGALLIMVFKETVPTLQTSPEARVAFLDHELALYLSFLSSVDSCSIIKDLEGTYDLEIEERWIKTPLLRPFSNYYLRLTYYENGDKEKGDKIPFIGNIEELELEGVNILHISKKKGEPIKLNKFESLSEAGVCIPEKYRDLITEVVRASDLPVLVPNPENFVAAIIQQESNWKPNAYRYEPNYDYRYVQPNLDEYMENEHVKDYVMTKDNGGITIEEWFNQHPERKGEKEGNRDYSKHIAQTNLSASYGLMQILYTTAIDQGFQGAPEDLYDPKTNMEWSVKYLVYLIKNLNKDYKTIDKTNLMKLADGAYNAGLGRINRNCVKGKTCEWESIREEMPSITQGHVKNVMGYYEHYSIC